MFGSSQKAIDALAKAENNKKEIDLLKISLDNLDALYQNKTDNLREKLNILRKEVDNASKLRQEFTINLLLNWSNQLQQSILSSRTFVDVALGLSKCQDLYGIYEISNPENFRFPIEKKYIGLVSVCLPNSAFTPDNNGEFSLNYSQVAKLRSQVLSYLNRLEAIMSAWKYAIADPDIIEEEFNPLRQNSSNFALNTFRTVVKNDSEKRGAGDPFPSITAFERKITQQQDSQREKKELLTELKLSIERNFQEIIESDRRIYELTSDQLYKLQITISEFLEQSKDNGKSELFWRAVASKTVNTAVTTGSSHLVKEAFKLIPALIS